MNLENLTFQNNLAGRLFQFLVSYTEKFDINPLPQLGIPPKNNTNDKDFPQN